MRRALLVAAILAGVMLAGCAGNDSNKSKEIIVESNVDDEEPNLVVNGDGVPAAPVQDADTSKLGHLKGVVVDEAIRPILEAAVHIPSLDLHRRVDRDGSWAFTDLAAGSYFVTADADGYYAAETQVDVEKGEFTRIKFVLKPIPVATPRNVTLAFHGYAELGATIFLEALLTCNQCDFDFFAGGPGFDTLLIEATMDEYAWSVPGSETFWHILSAEGFFSSGRFPNPMRWERRAGDLPETETSYHLYLEPEGFPVPEVSKQFDIYVTQWFNAPPPPGWSFLTQGQ